MKSTGRKKERDCNPAHHATRANAHTTERSDRMQQRSYAMRPGNIRAPLQSLGYHTRTHRKARPERATQATSLISPPKAQPPGNAQAHERRALVTTQPESLLDGLWRVAVEGFATADIEGSPKGRGALSRGSMRRISQVTGQRGGDRASLVAFSDVRGRLPLPFVTNAELEPWASKRLFTILTLQPVPGWWTSAVGTCPSITARRSKSTMQCDATPACSMSLTC